MTHSEPNPTGPIRTLRHRVLVVVSAVALAIVAFTGSLTPAGAADPAPVSNITITQTTSPTQGFCVPGWMALSRSIVNTPEYFELRIRTSAPPCQAINAKAAIYGMPGHGVAWPQTLVEVKSFRISKAGMTIVRFTKTCDPVQFDVLTGDTPRVISPTGPWHGPLLFPFDTATSHQHWGCVDNTTTSTDPCENYSARQLAVLPTVVAPGDTITVSGLGTPGTTLQVWVAPPAGQGGAGLGAVGMEGLVTSVAVPASGQWSVQFTIPAQGAASGTWTANAQASDCQSVTSVTFTVSDDAPGGNGDNGGVDDSNGGNGDNGGVDDSNETRPDDPGDVAVDDMTAERDLPSGAVKNVSMNTRTADTSVKAASESKLAWTGSNVRLPLVVGAAMLVVGILLVLRNRRATA